MASVSIRRLCLLFPFASISTPSLFDTKYLSSFFSPREAPALLPTKAPALCVFWFNEVSVRDEAALVLLPFSLTGGFPDLLVESRRSRFAPKFPNRFESCEALGIR